MSEGRCSRCGHTIGARCTECDREFLCGSVSAPCEREGCGERVMAEKYGPEFGVPIPDSIRSEYLFEMPRRAGRRAVG